MKYEVLRERLAMLANLAESVIHPTSKIAAGIWHRNRLIATGTNTLKSHPFALRYSRHPDCIFLHAEMAAILKATAAIDIETLKKCSLVVCRIKRPKPRSTKYIRGLAKPCPACERAIKETGIRNVWYSLDNSTEFACM